MMKNIKAIHFHVFKFLISIYIESLPRKYSEIKYPNQKLWRSKSLLKCITNKNMFSVETEHLKIYSQHY